jgi:hypothetical protein
VSLILATIFGAAVELFSVLIHQTIPPYGVLVALIFSYLAIWLVGRRLSGRKYKVAAAAGWVAVMLRAASFGAGQELLVQGDGVGSALLGLGTLVVLAAVAARI